MKKELAMQIFLKLKKIFLLLYLKIIYFYTFESKKIKILLPVCNSFNTSCKFKF